MYLYNFAGSTGDQHFLQVVAYVSLSTSSRVQAGSQRQGSKRTRQSVYCAPRLLADADEETQQADLAVWSSAARCVPPYLPAAARGAAWPAEEVADALMAERADDTEVGAAHSDSEGLPRLLRDLERAKALHSASAEQLARYSELEESVRFLQAEVQPIATRACTCWHLATLSMHDQHAAPCQGAGGLQTHAELGAGVWCKAEVPDTSLVFVDVGLGFHAALEWAEALQVAADRKAHAQVRCDPFITSRLQARQALSAVPPTSAGTAPGSRGHELEAAACRLACAARHIRTAPETERVRNCAGALRRVSGQPLPYPLLRLG